MVDIKIISRQRNTKMPHKDYYSFERTELIPFIPKNTERTLDVGCASGAFSEQLKRMFNAETWGIEMAPKAALQAKERVNHIFIGSFDEVYDNLPEDYFDCIFFNDVLEHMVDPEGCLIKIKKNLRKDKPIIASIPNIRHINILKELLLRKDWKYTDSGILDRTHLRFFTKKSMIRMFDDCGYKILKIKGINKIGTFCLTSILNFLMFNIFDDIKYQQYVIVATPK
ncbi:MAG: class I SAM-dependent methyltransferase [Dysgonomonas sp.]